MGVADVPRPVQAAQLHAQFQQLPPVLAAQAVGGGVFAAIMSELAAPAPLILWAAALALACALRFVVYRAYCRRKPSADRIRPWGIAAVAGAGSIGAIWEIGVSIFYPDLGSHPDLALYRYIDALLALGLVAGAVSTASVYLPTFYAFVLPLVAAFGVRLLAEGTPAHALLGGLYFLFVLVIVAAARRLNASFSEALELRFALEQRTRALDAANAQLQAEIAEREATEASLIQAQKLEAIGQLTGGVAHDFNNLLTPVLGNLDLVLSRETDERKLRLLRVAVQAAERGSALVQQLLAFSRRQHLHPQAVDVNRAIEGISGLLQGSIGPLVEVHLKLDPEAWPVHADATQLELAILNLAVNARDAMPGGGAFFIETANVGPGEPRRPADLTPGDYVRIALVDTGIGMSEGVVAKAFDPFFTTKEVGKGTGLGLSQVYGVIRQSGGTAAIESRLGHGTTVTLFLPRSRDAAAKSARETMSPAVAHGSGIIVLVVDDDEMVRDFAATVLREDGYGVIEAGDGEAALAFLAEREVHAMLVDIAMPGMSGLELERRVRVARPSLPILFMTGYADLGSVARLDEMRLLRKPFGTAKLTAKLAALLAHAPAADTHPVPTAPL